MVLVDYGRPTHQGRKAGGEVMVVVLNESGRPVEVSSEGADMVMRLRKEIEALRPDAERYRWLKQQGSTYDYNDKDTTLDDILSNYSERWDELIDNARK